MLRDYTETLREHTEALRDLPKTLRDYAEMLRDFPKTLREQPEINYEKVNEKNEINKRQWQ
jgi:hypothetical protein